MPRVRFEQKREAPVEFAVGFGSNLYRSALGRSLSLFNGPLKLLNCWGKGYCGACFVEVLEGAESLPARNPVESRKLRRAPASIRLACQLPVKGDLVIRKPAGILRPRVRPRPQADQARPAAASPPEEALSERPVPTRTAS